MAGIIFADLLIYDFSPVTCRIRQHPPALTHQIIVDRNDKEIDMLITFYQHDSPGQRKR